MPISIEPADAAEARPLRQQVLRPHQQIAELAYAGEDHPAALHLVARDAGGAVVGCASVVPEPHPEAPAPGDWRLRGMATAPAVRGTGVGRALLAGCIAHARGQGGARLWCNARTTAERFYAGAGFRTESDVFDAPPIGPHVRMSLSL